MILGAIMSHMKACQAEGQEARGKRERCSEQMESNSGATAEEWQRKDGKRVVFRLIEGGLLIH